MKKEFEVISQIIKNNKRVLDIGCGDGTLMEYLKVNQQNDVRGLEPQGYCPGTGARYALVAEGTHVVVGSVEGKRVAELAGVPSSRTLPLKDTSTDLSARKAPNAEVAIILCPQAWPIPGKASYSARMSILGPLSAGICASNAVSSP